MIAKLLARLKNDAHIPIGLVVFTVTTAYHFKTHIDLGPQCGYMPLWARGIVLGWLAVHFLIDQPK